VMSGIAHLPGIVAKLARAEEHLNALKTEIAVWGNSHSDLFRFDVRRDGDWQVVIARPFPEPPIHWALIAGDMVQNLRSALDHLIWQLVLRDGHQPSRSNQFPLIDTEQRFLDEVKFRKREPERSVLYGITVDGDAWTIIERAQPYNRPNSRFDSLSVLRRLSNRDKHQTLYVQMAFPNIEALADVIGWRPGAILLEQATTVAPLSFKQPTEIVRYRFDGTLDPGVHVKGRLAVAPTVGDDQADGAIQVAIGAFDGWIKRVDGIIAETRKLPRVMD